MTSDDPLWFKSAIIYEVHVRAFFDSNGDGKGDIQGLITRLPYLQDLGINCLWLLPMYPSPLRDDGYDIADFYAIHPDYGTLEEFQRLVDAAHARGIRVLTELVVNHTSDQHPWFQDARSRPDSPKRNWYVWSDSDQRYQGARIIFTDTERSNWTWDPVAKQYFWHRFFSHQPDLNYDNPEVQEEMLNVMRFWLRMGVDGFRCDAVPYLFEREGTNCENLPETHAFLKKLRATIDSEFQGRVLLAEANQWPADVRVYFGDGDEFHMGFHFPVMPRLFMSVRREERTPDRRDHAADAGDPRDLPVGHLPAKPRRADAGDGDRRGPRLHVPGVRQGPADEAQPGHSPAARPAHGQRAAPARAAPLAPLQPARHAGHVLRRRDWHG